MEGSGDHDQSSALCLSVLRFSDGRFGRSCISDFKSDPALCPLEIHPILSDMPDFVLQKAGTACNLDRCIDTWNVFIA